ncbi:MAG TPA: hypothetical protein DER07_06300 [Armatimonadetes bacterium]|nr:hypothetical protein [Armatimonadota bacterium]
MRIRQALYGLLATILAILVVRSGWIGAVRGRPQTEISFWNGFTGPDGRVMLELIRRFNRENPDLKVSMQRIAWGTYYNKLMVAAVNGRGPHVFVIHASALPRMHRAGFLEPMDSLYREGGVPEEDFEPIVLRTTEFDGHRVGVPLDIHPQGLYCNTDMLREAGIVDERGRPKPPTNREEFLRAASLMMHPRGAANPDRYGFALTHWQNNYQSVFPQFGGRYLDERGNADLDNPGNVEALEFLGRLRTEKRLIPPPDNQLGWIGFRQKKVGMVFDGVYMLGDLKRLEGLHYVGAPMPVLGHKPGTMADSHILCMRKGLSERERDGVARFIRFLSENSLDWAEAGQVPARRSVRNTDRFRSMQVQYAFSKQIPYMVYPPRIVPLFEMGLEINLAVERVIRGRMGAKESLRIADENAQKAIDRDRAESQAPGGGR